MDYVGTKDQLANLTTAVSRPSFGATQNRIGATQKPTQAGQRSQAILRLAYPSTTIRFAATGPTHAHAYPRSKPRHNVMGSTQSDHLHPTEP